MGDCDGKLTVEIGDRSRLSPLRPIFREESMLQLAYSRVEHR
jgi:hypothetical protein